MKKISFFILVITIMLLNACKDKVEVNKSENSLVSENAHLDSIYRVAMADLCADFSLKEYQAKVEYRRYIDKFATEYVQANADVFGDDILVLSSADLGENGEGLGNLLGELNTAKCESAESLERCYAKLQQKKRFKSPSIEQLIATVKILAKSPKRINEKDISSKNVNYESEDIADLYEFEEDIMRYGDSLQMYQITIEDLANEKGILIVGTTANIFLCDSVQIAMPVTVFKQIVEAEPSILEALENNNASKQKINRHLAGSRVPLTNDDGYVKTMVKLIKDATKRVAEQQEKAYIEQLLNIFYLNKTTTLNLKRSGWESGYVKTGWGSGYILYANYNVDKFVINNGIVIFTLKIYLENRNRVIGIRYEYEPRFHWMEYHYTFSIYDKTKPLKSWTNVDLWAPDSRFKFLTNIAQTYVYNGIDTYYYLAGVNVFPDFKVYESASYILPKLLFGEQSLLYGFEKIVISAKNADGCEVTLDHEAETITIK